MLSHIVVVLINTMKALFSRILEVIFGAIKLQYLTKIIETKSVQGKMYGNSGMVYFADINWATSTFSMWQHIRRVATMNLCQEIKLSEILSNNIDTWGIGIGLRIYVRYCK